MSEREAQADVDETSVCHVCGKKFPTQEELSKHLLDEHDEDTLGD
jgi:hypothetical protein